MSDDPDRKYGNTRTHPILTVENLLDKHSVRISNEERERVMEIVKSVYGRQGVQPSQASQGVQPCQDKQVAITHQIYGLFRGGEATPRLFENCQSRWQEVAQDIGAIYHIWSADDVDFLIKKTIPGCGIHIKASNSQ